MILKKLNSIKNEIPIAIRTFLGRALLFFIIWKIIYGLFLYDSKYLDHPLTTHVGVASTLLLNNLGSLNDFTTKRVTTKEIVGDKKVEKQASQIYHNGKAVLNIADVCNGLELIILYMGFIICMPSTFLRKILYIVIGVIILDLVNILRCAGLIYLREYFQAYFQFAHHFLFKASVYSVTFLMWVIYARKIHFKK